MRKHGIKIFLILVLILITSLTLAACSNGGNTESCSNHVDTKNHDAKCDICGATMSAYVHSKSDDANNDGKCDICGYTITIVNPLQKFTGVTFTDKTVDYDGQEHTIVCNGVPSGAKVEYVGNKGKEDGVYNATATISKDGYETLQLNARLTILMTAEKVVEARATAANDNKQNYDFKVDFTGRVSALGFPASASAHYDGEYRLNKSSGDYKFKRETSGALLYDSVEYIYNAGTSKIKINVDENDVVTKVKVLTDDDEGLDLINLPFVAVVDHIDANNLSGITRLSSGAYGYKANLALASDNVLIGKIFGVLAKQGSTIAIKDVAFSNPASGIDFFFNFNADKTKITDFKFSVDVMFPIKGVDTALTLSYEQKANDKDILLPSTASIYVGGEMSSEVAKIATAVAALKNSASYSLDVLAVNDFDPGISTLATVDKYQARMYKNTNGERVDFNYSYKHKSHTEEEGAEAFKYTIGNIQDGTVHVVSRKGTNTVEQHNDASNPISANERFDYVMDCTGVFALNAIENFDCMRKAVKGNVTTYYLYLGKTGVATYQNKIVSLLNSNTADGVIEVDNKYNSADNFIKDAMLVVEITDGKLTSVALETEIRYVPTSGEHSNGQVTLKNSIVIDVNKKADKAAEYTAPKSATSKLGSIGLINFTYYIL